MSSTAERITIGRKTYTILFPNLLRPLKAREETALRISIRKWGVRVPIVTDEYDGVIDGGNRLRIAAELGLKEIPVRVQKGLFLKDKEELALMLNDARRHLNASERKALAKQRKETVAEARANGESTRSIAEREGVSQKQVRLDSQRSGEEFSSPDHAAPATVNGRDGKEYPAQRTPETELVERKEEIRRLRSEGMSYRKIGKQLDLSYAVVWHAINGEKKESQPKPKPVKPTKLDSLLVQFTAALIEQGTEDRVRILTSVRDAFLAKGLASELALVFANGVRS